MVMPGQRHLVVDYEDAFDVSAGHRDSHLRCSPPRLNLRGNGVGGDHTTHDGHADATDDHTPAPTNHAKNTIVDKRHRRTRNTASDTASRQQPPKQTRSPPPTATIRLQRRNLGFPP